MKRKSTLIFLLTLILTLSISSNAFAYKLYPYGKSYSTAPLNKYYWTGGVTSGLGDVSTSITVNEIDLAVSRWSNTQNTKVWFMKTSSQSQSILDYHNFSSLDTGLLGQATRYVNNTIISPWVNNGDWYWAKVEMNKNFNWNDPDNPFKKSDGSPNPKYLITATAAHEAGHALGLDHVSNLVELMGGDAGFFYENRIYSPTPADANGVRAIYGPLN